MRRPHPYLAIALVCAAVVLATAAMLACPARAEIVNYNDGCNDCWRDTETGLGGCTLLACVGQRSVITTPIPRRTPMPTPSAQPTCLPLVEGVVVWPGSPECTAERGTDRINVPTADRRGGIIYFTIRVLNADLQTGALTTSLTMSAWGDVLGAASSLVPEFYDRPLYGKYAATPPALPPNCGAFYCGCASGLGTWPPKVDASQRLGRVEQLISWELTNAILGKLNRPDLWDNSYVSSVVSRVGAQIGGWSQ